MISSPNASSQQILGATRCRRARAAWGLPAEGEIRHRNRDRLQRSSGIRKARTRRRNEVRLVVALRRRRAQADDAVEVAAVGIADRHADKDVGAARGCGSRDASR